MEKVSRDRVRIRPETAKDYKKIIPLVLRSFSEGTDYSDGTDVMAFIEEIRQSRYYLPGLSFVAEMDGEIVGHFMFSLFPLSDTSQGDRDENRLIDTVMLAPVAVRADCLRRGVGTAMLLMGIRRAKEAGYRAIQVEGNFNFYNTLGFRTSLDYGVSATSGIPLKEPRCMMLMECWPGALKGVSQKFVVYDMYENA